MTRTDNRISRTTTRGILLTFLLASMACDAADRGITSPTAAAFARKPAPISILDLGTLPGGTQSRASSVNASGAIVGEADATTGVQHAVRWTVKDGIATIEDLTSVASFPGGTTTSRAFDVNDGGGVVGAMEVGGASRAFLLRGNTVIDLGVVPGAAESSAAALNDATPVQVVGASGTSAFIWTEGTGMETLPTLAGSSWATGVTTAGIVVGYSFGSNGSTSAVRWQKVGGVWNVTELADFAGATDVNQAGDAAGSRRSATGTAHAHLWPYSGGSVDLSTLGGGVSHALGINGDGEIVGWSTNKNGAQRAFLRRGSKMIDLGALVSGKGGQAIAEDINAAGFAVGSSQTSSGSGALSHAVGWKTK